MELEQIRQAYSNEDVVIISVSVDPEHDTVDILREFRIGPNKYSDLHYEMNWTIARDTVGVMQKYGITAAPTTVIIDKEGFISPHSPYVGLTDASVLKNEIDSLL